jgi:hypothetical protein
MVGTFALALSGYSHNSEDHVLRGTYLKGVGMDILWPEMLAMLPSYQCWDRNLIG